MKREELGTHFSYEFATDQEVYLATEADSVMDALEASIKSLQEENIAKDMAGAELMNENKALRHNLEDWKAENEALKECIKELGDKYKNEYQPLNDTFQDLCKKLEANQPKWISQMIANLLELGTSSSLPMVRSILLIGIATFTYSLTHVVSTQVLLITLWLGVSNHRKARKNESRQNDSVF